MTLQLRFVSDLSHTVEPAVRYLQQSTDQLFSQAHIIVPTAGVRTWLRGELAKRLGAQTGWGDGVVANVQVGYIGMLRGFIAPRLSVSSKDDGNITGGGNNADDPWSIDHLTHVVLEVLVSDKRYEPMCEKLGGPLQAARALADRFDRYSARRPSMIRAWENGSPVFAPTSADPHHEGQWRPAALGEHEWQFHLWRSVRERIGVASWPSQSEHIQQLIRNGERPQHVPNKLMLIGQQSLTVSSLELLNTLGHVSDIDALLVHPSPKLAKKWHDEFAQVPTTLSVLPLRSLDADVPVGVDPLMHTWLRGSRELQHMCTTQGISYELHQSEPQLRSESLLHRIQYAVANEGQVTSQALAADDVSVQIHRCYNLSRQAEVLHDALLHAFNNIPNLQPHEIVILAPRIGECAPLLDAVFQREITTSQGQKIRIPLVIADRSIRQVSDGSQLLSDLLTLLQGRFALQDVLRVATSDLVADHLRATQEDFDVWYRHMERAQVRWGIDADHRMVHGVNAPMLTAHTWQLAIERSILGATLPDSEVITDFGGVVPLTDVDTEEINALSTLAYILGVLSNTEDQLHGIAPCAHWCDVVEEALTRLCGTDDDELVQPLAAIDHVRTATTVPIGASAELTLFQTNVSFTDFVGLMSQYLEGSAGYQPLRTGAVTATSFIPLRGIPYRVVCVVGFDDGAFSLGESESDDLVAIQQFIGDDESRIDSRRAFFDAVLSAQDRLIVTCMGRSILNNSPIPLTTALAEFVDLCKRAGVADRQVSSSTDSHHMAQKATEIEYFHPRHFSSARNFVASAIVDRGVARPWSHNMAAKAAAGAAEAVQSKPSQKLSVVGSKLSSIELSQLERFVKDPLQVFTRSVMGISTWRESTADVDAVLPLELSSNMYQHITLQHLYGFAGLLDTWDEHHFEESLRANGQLPVGAYADSALEDIKITARNFAQSCDQHAILLTPIDESIIDVALSDKYRIRGTMSGYQPEQQRLSLVSMSPKYKNDHLILGLRLLVLAASGAADIAAYSVHRHKDEPQKAIVRIMKLHKDISVEDARTKVSNLCDLYLRAHLAPYPLFGDTARGLTANSNDIDYDKHSGAFKKFVESDSYANSAEAVVYGDTPIYEDIFVPNGDVVGFWTTLSAAYRIAGKSEGAVFEKGVPKSRSVVW